MQCNKMKNSNQKMAATWSNMEITRQWYNREALSVLVKDQSWLVVSCKANQMETTGKWKFKLMCDGLV